MPSFAKLEHICRKLDLQPGESFLDVGCGWGGLITHAAAEHGAISTGCTLSAEQFNFANELWPNAVLGDSVRVELSDYRDMQGPFDKIASVGMFEHVGRRRLKRYFATHCNRLLRPGGLVLNHGITRPESTKDSAETLFIRRKVFPGGEIPHLSDVIRSAEEVRFRSAGRRESEAALRSDVPGMVRAVAGKRDTVPASSGSFRLSNVAAACSPPPRHASRTDG